MGRVKNRMKRFAAVVLSLTVMVPVGVFGTSQTAKADGPTGGGLAAHAMTAYNEGWAYSCLLYTSHIVIALLLAFVIYKEKRGPVKYVYRTAVYLPSILTTASVAIAWYYMFRCV